MIPEVGKLYKIDPNYFEYLYYDTHTKINCPIIIIEIISYKLDLMTTRTTIHYIIGEEIHATDAVPEFLESLIELTGE